MRTATLIGLFLFPATAIAEPCNDRSRVGAFACSLHQGASYKLLIKSKAAPLTTNERATYYQQQVIHAAIARIPNMLSYANYGHEETQAGFKGIANLEDAIERGIGVCGTHGEMFIELMRRFGIKTRTVQFWWQNQTGSVNHFAVEAFWNGAWRLYDISSSAFFVAKDGRALSTQEALSQPSSVMIATLPFEHRLADLGPAFEYATAKDVSVTLDGVGPINIPLVADGDGFSANFKDVQNYAGDNRQDGKNSGGATLVFRGLQGKFRVSLDMAIGGCVNGGVSVNGTTLENRSGVQTIEAANPSRISVHGADDVCYAVFHAIKFTELGAP